ncbi:hypothetical protein E4191_10515 [Paracoccus liaowanqingii]|uniref:Uncharacterized protein n=1 Tax=Paracoccus liaowanqingii TaxID=2560053 RepID=A0A4P7HNY6_9RHOB|nr:hypothetical protein [Paracoccus liaowanqingii]QBX35087.1 hypothetical protein E4191_10515 [Paracoccus liaowanqingii]
MSRLQRVLCASLEALLAGEKPRMPDAGGDILDAFLHLSRARSYHQFGPNPITWEAMAAYVQLSRRPIPPHHAEIIMALDDVWMRDAGKRMAGQTSGAPAVPMVSSTPLSARLFDALTGG